MNGGDIPIESMNMAQQIGDLCPTSDRPRRKPDTRKNIGFSANHWQNP
jgi:hypothetical protein